MRSLFGVVTSPAFRSNGRVADDPLGAIAERYGIYPENPHGDGNPSHVCGAGVTHRASQGVSPATTRYWNSVAVEPSQVGRLLRREAGPTARTARQTNLYSP